MSPYLFTRIRRRPILTLCSLILAAVLSSLLCFLTGYRADQQQKLAQTQERFRIPCVVTNRQGTAATELRMSSSIVAIVTDPTSPLYPLIRDVEMTKTFSCANPLLSAEHSMLYGITSLSCFPQLDASLGATVEAPADFCARQDPVCLVSQRVYDALAEKTLTLEVEDPKYALAPGEGHGSVSLTVVGWYGGDGSEVFLPFGAAQELMMQISGAYSCDSLRFYAADNRNLDTLRQTASTWFGEVDPAAGDTQLPQVALTIHEEAYRTAITALEQNIARSSYLLPVLLALALGIGFLISLLATRHETRNYALMRSIGLTRQRLFFSILLEQAIPPLLAAAVLCLTMQHGLPVLLFLICYLLGCCPAAMRASRTAPLELLREQE